MIETIIFDFFFSSSPPLRFDHNGLVKGVLDDEETDPDSKAAMRRRRHAGSSTPPSRRRPVGFSQVCLRVRPKRDLWALLTAARPLVAPAWRQDGQWVHRIPSWLCSACFSDNGMRLDADGTTTAARRRSANKGADGRSERSASCHGSISTRTTRFCASMLCGFSRPDSRASTFRIVVPHVRNH